MIIEFGKNPPIDEIREGGKVSKEDPFGIEGIPEESAHLYLSSIIQSGEFEKAGALIKKFGFSDNLVRESAKKALSGKIYHDSAMEVVAQYDLPEEDVRDVIKNELLSKIRGFSWSTKKNIENLVNKFAMTDDLLEQPEVQEAIKVEIVAIINDPSARHLNTNIISDFVGLLDREKKVCLSEDVRSIAIARSREVLSRNWNRDFEEVIMFNEIFEISEEDLAEIHIDKLVGLINDGVDRIEGYLTAFPLSDSVIGSEKIQDAIAVSVGNKFSKAAYEADFLIEKFHPPFEVVKKLVLDAFSHRLFHGSDIEAAKNFLDRYSRYLTPDQYIPVVENRYLLAIENGAHMSYLDMIIRFFPVIDSFTKSEKVIRVASEAFMDIVSSDYTPEYVEEYKAFFNLNDSKAFDFLKKHPSFSGIIDGFGIGNLPDLLKFVKKHQVFVKWLKTNHEECVLDEADLGKGGSISMVDLNFLKKNGFDLNTLTEKDNEKAYEKAYDQIKGSKKLDWSDEVNIAKPFENGARKFGYKKMFQFINRDGLSHHDALHNFDKILELLEVSGVRPAQFYAQVLDQVRRDDSQYETGTAHHELNSLASVINLDIQDTFTKIKRYEDIEKLQALAVGLGSAEQVFASWKSLKKYKEVCDLLGRTEILDKLNELKMSGKMELYHFIETLAFHPSISMEKVFQFWQDPTSFLELGDSHDSVKVHDQKKPSNYTHIPNLDLTAENLRDAQVEGKLDELQAFRSLEIYYELPRTGEAGSVLVGEVGLADLVKEAVGSFREKKVGKAKDPKKLLKELNGLLKSLGIDYQELIAGEKMAPEVEARIKSLIEDERIGYKKTSQVETVRYRAKTNLKSDPDGVTAGNDTACCMPFGSGKNNVYTFNPACTLFTVQQERADGTWRTVAQSVLTKDRDVKRNFTEVMRLMGDPQKPKLDAVLPEEVLRTGEAVLACDNVELTPNVRGHRLTEGQVEMIYRDFMAEYLARHAKSDNLSDKQVVIGQGYSDSLTHLPTIENTFVPLAPVAYSDKTHEKVFQLIPKLAANVKKQVVEHGRPRTKDVFESNQKGVSYLTFEDSIPVAYLEGKIYADNPSLIQYLHNMENGLIAKDINEHAKDRANMSFKHTGEDGKVHGYLLAYEGRLEDGDHKGEQVVYVSDIASDQKNPGTGKALMLSFLEQYRRNYVNKGNFIPIYAQAREKTSYAIIMKKLADYGSQVGLDLELEEVGNYGVGADTMHQILIRVKK